MRAPVPPQPAPRPVQSRAVGTVADAQSVSDSSPQIGRLVFATERYCDARDYLLSFHGKAFSISRLQPPSSSRLWCCHRQAQVKRIWLDVTQVRCANKFEIMSPELTDRFLLQFPLSGSCLVQQDGARYVAPQGSVFIINPYSPARKLWSGSMSQIMVWIDRALVETVLQEELGYELDRQLEFVTPDRAGVTHDATLLSHILHIASCIEMASGDPLHWRFARRLERCLIASILTSLKHNYSEEFGRSERHAAPYYVRRVEKFFKENLEDAITMRDVFDVAGVRGRTLFYGFRRYRKTTPMAFLKALRLEESRRRLLKTAAVGGSVTDIAMSCGFNHAGIFARAYKRRFGETPSETLRRGFN
jgi:AraC-like DNA-binding protein